VVFDDLRAAGLGGAFEHHDRPDLGHPGARHRDLLREARRAGDA
jgi:hypothetical protein